MKFGLHHETAKFYVFLLSLAAGLTWTLSLGVFTLNKVYYPRAHAHVAIRAGLALTGLYSLLAFTAALRLTEAALLNYWLLALGLHVFVNAAWAAWMYRNLRFCGNLSVWGAHHPVSCIFIPLFALLAPELSLLFASRVFNLSSLSVPLSSQERDMYSTSSRSSTMLTYLPLLALQGYSQSLETTAQVFHHRLFGLLCMSLSGFTWIWTLSEQALACIKERRVPKSPLKLPRSSHQIGEQILREHGQEVGDLRVPLLGLLLPSVVEAEKGLVIGIGSNRSEGEQTAAAQVTSDTAAATTSPTRKQHVKIRKARTSSSSDDNTPPSSPDRGSTFAVRVIGSRKRPHSPNIINSQTAGQSPVALELGTLSLTPPTSDGNKRLSLTPPTSDGNKRLSLTPPTSDGNRRRHRRLSITAGNDRIRTPDQPAAPSLTSDAKTTTTTEAQPSLNAAPVANNTTTAAAVTSSTTTTTTSFLTKALASASATTTTAAAAPAPATTTTSFLTKVWPPWGSSAPATTGSGSPPKAGFCEHGEPTVLCIKCKQAPPPQAHRFNLRQKQKSPNLQAKAVQQAMHAPEKIVVMDSGAAVARAKAEAAAQLDMEAEKKAQQEAAAKKAQMEAEQKAREEAAKKAQEEAEKQAKEEAAKKKAQEDAKAREDAEKKAEEEAEKKAKEAEKKAKQEAEKKAKEEADKRAKEEAEKAKEEADKKAREEAVKRDASAKRKASAKRREEAKRKLEEEERLRKEKEEAERKAAAELEARKRQEAEEARRKKEAEEARVKKDEEQKKRKEEAEKKTKEEAEQKALEARKRQEAEEARRKKEAEEARVKADEEQKKRKEEAEKKTKEEAEQKAKEAEKKATEEAEKAKKQGAAKKALEVFKAKEEAEKKAKEETAAKKAQQQAAANKALGVTLARAEAEKQAKEQTAAKEAEEPTTSPPSPPLTHAIKPKMKAKRRAPVASAFQLPPSDSAVADSAASGVLPASSVATPGLADSTKEAAVPKKRTSSSKRKRSGKRKADNVIAQQAAEMKAQMEAKAKERKAKEEAKKKGEEEAEKKAKDEAEKKVKEEAEQKAKDEAEKKAKEEAEKKVKEETEKKAKEEAEKKAKEEAGKKVKEAAEKKANEEAEKAKEEAEKKAKEEAERKAAERKAQEEPKAAEAEKKAKEEAAKRDVSAKRKASVKRKASEKRKAEAEKKAKEEVEKKAREEAEAKKKAEQEAQQKAKEEQEAKKKAEQDEQLKAKATSATTTATKAAAATTAAAAATTTLTDMSAGMSAEEWFAQFKQAQDAPAIVRCFRGMLSAAHKEEAAEGKAKEEAAEGKAGSATAHQLPTHGLEVYALLKKHAARTQFLNKRWFQMLDERLAVTWYMRRPLRDAKVVVVGGGPAGLRTAVEVAMLGGDITILEKRPDFSRNNILHIWDTSIVDLKALGAQFFDSAFGVRAINHYSIRELQCLLLRVCLVLGVRFLPCVEYCCLLKPVAPSKSSAAAAPAAQAWPRRYWHVQARWCHPTASGGSSVDGDIDMLVDYTQQARTQFAFSAPCHAHDANSVHVPPSLTLPPAHPSLLYLPAHVLIGADGAAGQAGEHAGIAGMLFKGGAEAIGLTSNFVNTHTKEETAVKEMACSPLYAPKIFNRLREQHKLQLENLVYFHGKYTHYIVCCPKLTSLLERKVVRENRKAKGGVDACLLPDNVDDVELAKLIRDLADELGIPAACQFAQVRGRDDMALFNFANKRSRARAVSLLSDHHPTIPTPADSKDSTDSMKGAGQEDAGPTADQSRLLVCLAGDALQEPFWPLGTGANRAILSALDTAWFLTGYSMVQNQKAAAKSAIELARLDREEKKLFTEREQTFQAMKQCLPDTLLDIPNKAAVQDMDPSQRYQPRQLQPRTRPRSRSH
eukprot:g65819.t1